MNLIREEIARQQKQQQIDRVKKLEATIEFRNQIEESRLAERDKLIIELEKKLAVMIEAFREVKESTGDTEIHRIIHEALLKIKE